MTKWFSILVLLLEGFSCFAQNGPGGVGTSANNVLWLDANRGLTVSGTSVTAWADQSGNGFNATPPTAAARPTRVASSVNGYPTIDFDGTNDEFWVNDNAALDLTSWHFFTVPLIDLQKNYNALWVKGDDSFENYEWIGFSDASVHAPIKYTDASRTFPNTTTAQLTATANVFEYSYSSAVGRDIYRNNTSIHTDNENKTPATNNFSLYIGNERSTTGRFLDGDLAEVIIYNGPLNSAQRIIVNNYLAAKYNCTLTANDLYTMDNAANGNFDHDVAGIGRVNAGNIHNDSRGSGIVRILNPTGLGDNEYYFWGHDNGTLGAFGTADYPSGEGLQGRLVRVWRGSEVGTITNFEVRFDLTGLGSVTASQLRLLIDTDNDGLFADETVAGGGVISGATTLGANVYGFNTVTGLNNGIRFTIGTTSLASTPLPIELSLFEAEIQNQEVKLHWQTLSEKNNALFEPERSEDGFNFTKLGEYTGKGNFTGISDYFHWDSQPMPGVNYYRIKQIDFDQTCTYSPVLTINHFLPIQVDVFPNPALNKFSMRVYAANNQQIQYHILDELGKEQLSGTWLSGDGAYTDYPLFIGHLQPGVYWLKTQVKEKVFFNKLVIQ